MLVLVLDTETTGLPTTPRGIRPNTQNIDQWPHIVQLSWLMYDVKKGSVTEHDYVVQTPSGIAVPEESTAIHGITERMSKNGTCLKDVLGILKVCMDQAQIIVGHNLDFDLDMVRSAVLRADMGRDTLTLDQVKIYYCTMKHGRALCNIVTHNGFVKPPRLEELHRYIFNETATNLHNSMTDVLVCFRCFHYMMYETDICSVRGKLAKSRIVA